MERSFKNLFVAKLPRHILDADLYDIFAAHKPVSATVMLDAVTGRSKGFGFVLFETAEAGKAAEQALNKQPVSVGGQVFELTIFPSKHAGTTAAEESRCLFIRNIPNTWSMAEVDAFIARHGTPVYSAVRSDHHGSPVWVVFVEYDSVESARNTLRNIHGLRVGKKAVAPVLAKFAESSNIKKQRRSRMNESGTEHEHAHLPDPIHENHFDHVHHHHAHHHYQHAHRGGGIGPEDRYNGRYPSTGPPRVYPVAPFSRPGAGTELSGDSSSSRESMQRGQNGLTVQPGASTGNSNSPLLSGPPVRQAGVSGPYQPTYASGAGYPTASVPQASKSVAGFPPAHPTMPSHFSASGFGGPPPYVPLAAPTAPSRPMLQQNSFHDFHHPAMHTPPDYIPPHTSPAPRSREPMARGRYSPSSGQPAPFAFSPPSQPYAGGHYPPSATTFAPHVSMPQHGYPQQQQQQRPPR